jgi:ankyrin repeat protein
MMKSKFSQLHRAAGNGSLDKITRIIDDQSCDLNKQCLDDGTTALYMACQEGHLDVVKLLLGCQRHVDPNLASTLDGSTPLHVATQKGHLEIVELLLIHGAQVNRRKHGEGATALYLASQSGNIEVIKTLIKYGADPNLGKTSDGATPLYIATQNGYTEIVEFLVENGADPHIRLTTSSGPNALVVALYKQHTDLIKLFQKYGVEVPETWKDRFKHR